MTSSVPALAMRGISKRFGATHALEDVSFTVDRGSLHALLGENGAGKTTLMRIAFGMLHADAGTIEVAGRRREWRSSADAIAAGLGMVHQHFMLVPAFTVAENVALGDRGLFSGFDGTRSAERVRRLGEATGLVLDPSTRVADLPVGAQQRLEIVKALSRDARTLILDEPTAVLSPGETEELYAWLRRFVRDGGSVVLITHKVREALAVADAVTILRRGRTVFSSAVAEVTEDRVVSTLLGETGAPRGNHAPPAQSPADAVVLSLRAVSVVDARGTERLRDASLSVRSGEIVGVAGIEGAGQWELLRVLAGRLAPRSGSVRLASRIGFAPEDRLRDAVIPSMTLAENVALQDAGMLRGRVPWRAFEARARRVTTAHDVRPGDARTVGALSGGNQQKFVLGRELDGAPEALVVENPTRGLDLRATDAVLAALRDARDSGCAVVVYSSDLDEVLGLADRMVVCYDGTLTEVPVESDRVGRAMVGIH
ncbi:MAG: ABC transporter ATP-binding protein [Gemmatimonadetes bacterium]|nr:ABC transporter ATP-binding protein [Gemmatimonadota bacterium]MBI3504568.1 ABC transporter ATP-binding protein [Pseudomonadota bacterium]